MGRWTATFGLIATALLYIGCETDITVDLPQPVSRVVVEATIEPGTPPFVTLTKNAPFFGEVNLNDLDGFFVHGAEMTITDGITTVPLVEYCLDDLPPELLALASDLLGIPIGDGVDFDFNICLYTIDFLGGSLFFGQPGSTYTLDIKTGEDQLSARTNLLSPIPPDSLWWTPHPDAENDTLVSLNIRYTDPDTLGNFYRYFTRRNSQPYYPGVNSVFDDLFINGQTFDFSLDRGQPRSADFDIDTYGYFNVGDTVILKWATLDKRAYDFWASYEFDAGSGGPFSSATVLATNIEGGLGVFCGYGAAYDTLVVGF